ncbi:MAG: hypothetical protein ACPL28_12370 [bacterium]
MIKLSTICILILIHSSLASYDAQFIKVGSGADALAMGETSADINPIFAPIYNDAIMGLQKGVGFGFTHIKGRIACDYLPSWFIDYWTFILPIPKLKAHIGLSNLFFNTIVEENGALTPGNLIVETDNSIKISFSKIIGEQCFLGCGVKAITPSLRYVTQYIGPNAFYAFDLSGIYEFKTFSIIASIQNVGGSVKYEGWFRNITGDTNAHYIKIDAPLPTEIRLGGGWARPLLHKEKISLCLDIRKGIGDNPYSSIYFTGINLGGEIGISEKIFLRIGTIYEYFKNHLESRNTTCGIGAKIDFLKIDVGMCNTAAVNKFSLAICGGIQ